MVLEGAYDVSVTPALLAKIFKLSENSIFSTFIKNLKTSPPSWQPPKQCQICRSGETTKLGVFSLWNGQRPLKFAPVFLSTTYSDINATASIFCLICSTSVIDRDFNTISFSFLTEFVERETKDEVLIMKPEGKDLRREHAETAVRDVEASWSAVLPVLTERYGDTLVGEPSVGFLAVRTEGGKHPSFRAVLGQSEPLASTELFFTKYGPVIGWISPDYVSWDERTIYWQKPDVQAAILKYAKGKLTESILRGEVNYEHEMRGLDQLVLPGFQDPKEGDKPKDFLFVDPRDSKMGDECLKQLLEQHEFFKANEKKSFQDAVNAATTMANKFTSVTTTDGKT